MPLSTEFSITTRGLRRPGSRKPPIRNPREDLDPLAVVRRVGDDEGAVGFDRERGRIDDLSGLAADGDDLPRARLLGVEAIDRMAAAIEHEILT
jgi:hypothetical protein